jgi:1-deoxy-D-xylulose-5-phosphate reductoisomerase
MRNVALLGGTGSIGQSTLKVLRLHPEKYRLYGVSAHRQIAPLFEICKEFRPSMIVLSDARVRADFQQMLSSIAGYRPELLIGQSALTDLAAHHEVDTVVAAIVGAAGLASTYAAAASGKRILLANKEALVIGGDLVTAAAQKSGAQLLPVDSEHNALFQCLPAQRPFTANMGIKSLWLTASGGPFRTASAELLASATPEQACAHPRWIMGRKISVDSATLMNKGLEVIEAHWLFGLKASDIHVVIHPQSTLHSMVEYIDGSFLAQLGSPDMCTPIAHALAWPERIDAGVARLNPLTMGTLDFSAPDFARFPALQLAYDALNAGSAACVVLNAANEIAVERFLNGQLAFMAIYQAINACLQHEFLSSTPSQAQLQSVESVLALDLRARRHTSDLIDAGRF